MPVKIASTGSYRNATIDLLRASAVVLMLIFHFIYDLNFFSLANIDIPSGAGWRELRAVIVSLFLITMGASLKLAYPKELDRRSFLVRMFTLASSALLVSLASYIFIKEHWIFFGIIHFILLASLLAISFRHSAKISLSIAITLLGIDQLNIFPSRWPFDYIGNWLPIKTNDFVAIFPWLAFPFLGIWLAHKEVIINDPCRFFRLPKLINWISRHSLIIYLLHQPIFLSLCFGYKQYLTY